MNNNALKELIDSGREIEFIYKRGGNYTFKERNIPLHMEKSMELKLFLFVNTIKNLQK